MGVSAHSQMTGATSQAGSKQWPWEARKEELEAWNHAEVRDPDHVILNPRLGASDTWEEALGRAGKAHKAFRNNQLCPSLASCVTLCDLNPTGPQSPSQ